MGEIKRAPEQRIDEVSVQQLRENHETIQQQMQEQMNFLNDSGEFQDGQGDGVPKACLEQAAVDSWGSRTCVCANTCSPGVAHAGEEGRINVLPWYRPVGVAIVARRKNQAARKSKWSRRGTEMTVLTYPCPSQPCFGGSKECARVTGKAGEIGQYSGAGRQLTLGKTVGSHVWWHIQGQSALRLDLGWWPGQPVPRVAIDWVTGRSCSSAITARRRLDVESGLRKGKGDGITLPARA